MGYVYVYVFVSRVHISATFRHFWRIFQNIFSATTHFSELLRLHNHEGSHIHYYLYVEKFSEMFFVRKKSISSIFCAVFLEDS